jgi:hypothetical protein
VSLFVLSPEIEDRDEVEVSNWAKHKKPFYLLVRLIKKKATSIVPIEIHKGAIFDRSKINLFLSSNK